MSIRFEIEDLPYMTNPVDVLALIGPDPDAAAHRADLLAELHAAHPRTRGRR